jgi:hypothetical protein
MAIMVFERVTAAELIDRLNALPTKTVVKVPLSSCLSGSDTHIHWIKISWAQLVLLARAPNAPAYHTHLGGGVLYVMGVRENE